VWLSRSLRGCGRLGEMLRSALEHPDINKRMVEQGGDTLRGTLRGECCETGGGDV